ncbi:MAG: pyrroline-5-carboxylate reductase [Alphaproteobacteria bacterium]|nr:pyrroline-5-carboxylate reductase [Alphaproteobacteria bacterium]
MNTLSPATILLAGCGKMGSAMVQGWISKNLLKHTYILDPNGLPDELQGNDCISLETPENIDFSTIDLVVLAVKPQIMADVCATMKPHINENTPLLSIAAGQSITGLQSYFQENQPVIRSMPNTPAAIGKGITAAITSHTVSHETKSLAEQLLQASGDIIWLDDEAYMDAVTALSGSGPAYVFYLIEIMTQAGKDIGLSAQHAEKLARQTVIGASALAETENQTSAATLRENVTSPGGTTAAALDKLMDGRMQELFTEALTAAKDRSIELS